jgi:hypothetical protein
MALLVFLTFLALFTNTYVPIWMLDNERGHMAEVSDQFSDLKGKIDNMVVMASTTGSTTLNMYAPFTLGSNGIPIFATATAGQLTYVPFSQQNASVEVKFVYGLDALHPNTAVDSYGGGMVQLYAPNRYYVQQWMAYENGAILVKQIDGQLINAIPSLDVSKSGSYSNVSFTQFNFIGKNTTVTGTGATGLNIEMIYLDQESYMNYTATSQTQTPLLFTMTFHTQYGLAWYSYLDKMLRSEGLNNQTEGSTHDYKLIYGNPSHTVVTLSFLKVYKFNYNVATLNLAVPNA